MFERRTHRTTDPVEALTRLLESHRERLGAKALALSTPEGVLLAGSGDGVDHAAEIGARIDRSEADVHEALFGDVATWRLMAGQVELLLTSVGGRLSYDVGSGVRRIVAELAS
jgi:hypothetical protein